MTLKRLTIVALAIAGLVTVRLEGQTPAAPPNAALRYWMAFAMMRDPPSDQTTADLLETVATGKASWNEGQLGPILDLNRSALETMQRGSKLAFCDWGIEYELGSRAPIAHLARARVLARLNVLAGERLVSRGQTAQAVDVWVAGVRFSQHVARGGSLISLWTARAALGANVEALSRVVMSGSAGVTQRTRIEEAMKALPETGFDWAEAMRLEEESQNVSVQELQRALDPKATYRALMGQAAPDGFTAPAPADVKRFHDTMSAVVNALRLPPDQARGRLSQIEADRKTLHPFFRQTLPSPSRINEARAQIQAERQRLLTYLAAPRPV